jgi:hypothetical protein
MVTLTLVLAIIYVIATRTRPGYDSDGDTDSDRDGQRMTQCRGSGMPCRTISKHIFPAIGTVKLRLGLDNFNSPQHVFP